MHTVDGKRFPSGGFWAISRDLEQIWPEKYIHRWHQKFHNFFYMLKHWVEQMRQKLMRNILKMTVVFFA